MRSGLLGSRTLCSTASLLSQSMICGEFTVFCFDLSRAWNYKYAKQQ